MSTNSVKKNLKKTHKSYLENHKSFKQRIFFQDPLIFFEQVKKKQKLWEPEIMKPPQTIQKENKAKNLTLLLSILSPNKITLK